MSDIRYFSAEVVFPISSKPIHNGYVACDKKGKIISIGKVADLGSVDVQHFKGILVPGFVNAHCHLELSHLKGRVDTGTGLLPFLKKVVTYRDASMEQILSAIEANDSSMYASGIVAVGDICNTSHALATKLKSDIAYYNFVEMFDFMQPSMTSDTITQYTRVYQEYASAIQSTAYVPHSPYTVSEDLFDYINANNITHKTVSVHNQETPAETDLFANGTGDFISFFEHFGFDKPRIRDIGKTSIHYLMRKMDANQRTLFVHNTLTSRDDVAAAKAWSDHTYWATCPNANLYIENRLPDYQMFVDAKANVCIGTDSLTSNWQLDLWEEVKTIKRYQSSVPLEILLTWATANGAKALGFDDKLGALEVGKTPGIVHINANVTENHISIANTSSKRVA